MDMMFEQEFKLFLRKKFTKDGISYFSDDLWDNIADYVTKINLAQVLKRGNLFFLRNEEAKGLIEGT